MLTCMPHGFRCDQKFMAFTAHFFRVIKHAHTITLVWRFMVDLGGKAMDAFLGG